MKKFLHIVFGLCMLGGFIFMLGTAGASDMENIDVITAVVNSAIGLAVMLIGYFGLRLSGSKFVA